MIRAPRLIVFAAAGLAALATTPWKTEARLVARAGGVDPPPAAPPAATTGLDAAVQARPGPAGSLLMVEPNHALPLAYVVAAVRSGSSWDPHRKDGLANLVAETARRGAAGRGRSEIDAQLSALGVDLDVKVDPDSIRFEGHVLGEHVDELLAILADILLRPDFTPAEIARTRREVLANLDELRNDDRALCQRFFLPNLYGDHPYGHPVEGDRKNLDRIRREDILAFHRQHFVGANLILAAAGDVTAEAFSASANRWFQSAPRGPAPGPNPLAVREPQPPRGWRVQIVDKPERRQAQILFGQFAVRATDPDYLPLLVASTSFGGQAMNATLMDEVRVKRGLAYGAYMTLSERRGRGALTGWVFAATEKAVPTLKLALKLYLGLMEQGLDDRRVAFAKTFLAGSQAFNLDDPAHRLDQRVSAEVVGLPPTFVDQIPERLRAIGAGEVRAAIARHVRARDLAITVVATGPRLRQLLLDAKVQASAIDVVPYDSY